MPSIALSTSMVKSCSRIRPTFPFTPWLESCCELARISYHQRAQLIFTYSVYTASTACLYFCPTWIMLANHSNAMPTIRGPHMRHLSNAARWQRCGAIIVGISHAGEIRYIHPCLFPTQLLHRKAFLDHHDIERRVFEEHPTYSERTAELLPVSVLGTCGTAANKYPFSCEKSHPTRR